MKASIKPVLLRAYPKDTPVDFPLVSCEQQISSLPPHHKLLFKRRLRCGFWDCHWKTQRVVFGRQNSRASYSDLSPNLFFKWTPPKKYCAKTCSRNTGLEWDQWLMLGFPFGVCAQCSLPSDRLNRLQPNGTLLFKTPTGAKCPPSSSSVAQSETLKSKQFVLASNPLLFADVPIQCYMWTNCWRFWKLPQVF